MNRFISENQLDEQRKKRQEEWEKVRKADDPIDVPEEEYDPRSLYDRLQEQKDKKQEEFEEKLKFKNQFRGIDQDEASFLDNVASHLAKMEKQRNEDVNKEIADFKKAIATRELNDKPSTISLASKKEGADCKHSAIEKKDTRQKNILKMAVKRKSNTGAADKQTDEPNAPKLVELDTGVVATKKNKTEVDRNAVTSNQVIVYPPAQKCIGILPGISGYEDSDDSDSSLVDLCDSSSSS